ncbi:MAG: DUF1801 domain-containing protein [Bacteroidetes bacterium]|nr:DUF1801 domain-containing protein [Bacteroidota bacterium]
MDKSTVESVNAYIAGFPKATRELLREMRAIIMNAAPEAEETISYRMPAYKYQGILVYFAAYKGHIGFYPTASGIHQFQKEIAAYKSSKGAVQFPLDKPLPAGLITKMVKFKVKENQEKAKAKKKK